VSILAAAAAVLVRWLFDPWLGERLPLSTLYAAVALAVWFAGIGPALATTAVGYVLCDMLFVAPRGQLHFPLTAIGVVPVYLASCFIIIGIGEALHAAQRRLEQQHAQSQANEEFYRAVTDLTSDYAWIARVYPDGHYVNEIITDGVTKLVGYTVDELKTRGWRIVVHPDEQLHAMEIMKRLLHGEDIDEEMKHVTKDGRVLWLHVRGHPIRNERGQVTQLVGSAKDITHERQVEQEVHESNERLRLLSMQLREADRRKDEFLAILAHELRNPLAPIRNALELMGRANGDSELVQDARAIMERQVGQMVRLVDDLLEVSRVTRGALELRKQRIELTAAVHSAVEATQPLIQAAGHKLVVNLPPEPVHLDADPARLAQVFSNLLNNAAKYTDSGGHIWLNAELETSNPCQTTNGESVVVSVRDTGIGIPADHLPRLFEMFSQVAPSLERSRGGLGIGLSLARALVELHGGVIEAKSGGPGKGSEFIIRLPAVRSPQPSKRAPMDRHPEDSASTVRHRVLVVDDHQDAANTMARMLRMLGHETNVAHDGVEAVQAAAAFHPEVVFLDIGMPKMNGYEAARQIRQESWGRTMKLVAVTGWGQEDDKRRAAEAGFDRHLIKPVDPAVVEEILASL
jgi:PAS domain S-box-containing protein